MTAHRKDAARSRGYALGAGARALRFVAAVGLGLVWPACLGIARAADPASVRRLEGVDLAILSCADGDAHRAIGSEAALEKFLAGLAAACPPKDFEPRRAAFLSSLESAGVDWSEEVLVIALDHFGTGKAKAGLVFSGPAKGLLTASIRWKVPPPPVTPDTASCSFVFAVRRSAVRRIRVESARVPSASFAVAR